MVDRTLFEVAVRESDKNRDYWASRDWIGEALADVRGAAVLIVPWEDFRENQPTLFPQGTSDFLKRLRAAGVSVGVAATRENYTEIALHAHAWRFPTLLFKLVLLPAVASLLAAEIHDVLERAGPADTIEIKIIVEGEHGKGISIDYKGAPSRALDTLVKEVEHCFPHNYLEQAPPVGVDGSNKHRRQKNDAK